MAEGALGGTSAVRDARTIVRCIEWLLQHGEPIEEKLWERAYDLALNCPDPRASLRAIDLIADRIDPAPKVEPPSISTQINGPAILIWDLSTTEVPPISAPRAPKSTSSGGSNGSTSSSAIAAGEKPPSASTG